MFCFKCGEAIPDASKFCPMCGAKLKEAQQTIIYASQKEPVVEPSQKGMTKAGLNNKNVFILWGILAVVSFVFTAMNYMSVSVSVWHSSRNIDYSGYYLTECLGGTARTSGIMVILLIIINISVIVVAGLGIWAKQVRQSTLRKVMLCQSIAYLIVTIIPYFHLQSLLSEFDSSLSETSIGPGCYMNIILSIIAVILYFAVVAKNLTDVESITMSGSASGMRKRIYDVEDKVRMLERLRDEDLISEDECMQKIKELRGK